MARAKRSVHSKKHRRAVLKAAEGYSGSRSRHRRKANEQLLHSGQYAFRDRRARKGQFRRLWIVRINAACREHDISYSRFLAGLRAAARFPSRIVRVRADSKLVIEQLAGHWRDEAAFGALVTAAREALEAA